MCLCLRYYVALHRTLDQRLIETLEMSAAALRPEVSRDAEGLTELEFVICMACDVGLVDMKHLQPFIDQFRSLDVIGNGRVGMKDLMAKQQLKWQLERAKKARSNSFQLGVGGGDTRLGTLTEFMNARNGHFKRSETRRLDGRRGRPSLVAREVSSAAGSRWIAAGAQVSAGKGAEPPKSAATRKPNGAWSKSGGIKAAGRLAGSRPWATVGPPPGSVPAVKKQGTKGWGKTGANVRTSVVMVGGGFAQASSKVGKESTTAVAGARARMSFSEDSGGGVGPSTSTPVMPFDNGIGNSRSGSPCPKRTSM